MLHQEDQGYLISPFREPSQLKWKWRLVSWVMLQLPFESRAQAALWKMQVTLAYLERCCRSILVVKAAAPG